MADTPTGAYTLEKLKALEEAIADGVRRVKYTDKEIEYRSLDEMNRIAQNMRRHLGMGTKSGKRGIFGGRRVVVKHSKGLDD